MRNSLIHKNPLRLSRRENSNRGGSYRSENNFKQGILITNFAQISPFPWINNYWQCGPPQKRLERSTMASMRLLTKSKPVLSCAVAVPEVSAITLRHPTLSRESIPRDLKVHLMGVACMFLFDLLSSRFVPNASIQRAVDGCGPIIHRCNSESSGKTGNQSVN